tara:strand:- start:34 stop:1062 length:1029 start_codon:yes stop_codon:yes gene_type:complete
MPKKNTALAAQENTALAAQETGAAVAKTRSVLASMASRYHTDGNQLLATLKNTVFKGATNEQLVALCIVADQYNLNPFVKEIYAFPDKKTGGIIPVVGIDGWLRIINDHPQYDGMEVEMDGENCTVTIHRKDRGHPTVATEYLEECRRNTGPWDSHPVRMLRHKAIIQCARIAFGFALKDPDEAERIIEAQSFETDPIAMPTQIAGAVTTPEQTSRPETQEAAPAGTAIEGIIEKVFHKKSRSDAKKPWERWGVVINGETYGTFDANNGALAVECEAEGCGVVITASADGEYKNLTSIQRQEVEDVVFVPTADPEQTEDDGSVAGGPPDEYDHSEDIDELPL